MRIILLVFSAAVVLGQNATPPPEVAGAPKARALSELNQARVEKLQAQLSLLKFQERDLNREFGSIIESECADLGGKAGECTWEAPTANTPWTVRLKPKADVKKVEPAKPGK
jgi:hypothetical protein